MIAALLLSLAGPSTDVVLGPGESGIAIARLEQAKYSNWSLKLDLPLPARKPQDPVPVASLMSDQRTKVGFEFASGSQAVATAFGTAFSLPYSSETLQHLEIWSLDGTLSIRWNGVVRATFSDDEATPSFRVTSDTGKNGFVPAAFSFAQILPKDVPAVPAYVPFAPGRRQERVATPGTLEGCESIDPPAIPYGEGNLIGIVGAPGEIDVAAREGGQIAFIPSSAIIGSKPLGYVVMNGMREVAQRRLAARGPGEKEPTTPFVYTVARNDLPSQRMRICVVDGYDDLKIVRQHVVQWVNVREAKAFPKATVVDSEGDSLVKVEGASVKTAYLFAGTNYLGAAKVVENAFRISAATLPPSREGYVAILADGNLLYPPITLALQPRRVTALEIDNPPKVFVVRELGSTALVKVRTDRPNIARTRLFLNGRFVAESDGATLERAILLNSVPTGDVELAAQATDATGRVYPVETVTLAVRNDVMDTAATNELRRKRLAEVYDSIMTVDEQAASWFEKARNEPEMRKYQTSDYYVTVEGGQVLGAGKMSEHSVPGRAGEYLAQAQACLYRKARYQLTAARLERALGMSERARRTCQEIIAVAPGSEMAKQAKEMIGG